jgi:hypothetical protein
VESQLAEHEPTLVFCALFFTIAVAAVWEVAAPRRPLTAALRARWINHLAICGLSTVGVRILVPTAIPFALLAAERGWGLLNVTEAPAWLAIPGSVLALDLSRISPASALSPPAVALAFPSRSPRRPGP